MDDFEDFVIDMPYSCSDEDMELISSSQSYPPVAEDWYKDRLQAFKNRFKDYIEQQQNSYCAYCRTYVDTGNSPFDIEHIVPKSRHAQWTFNVENLCLSCRKCNFAKGKKETLVDKDAEEYPHNGNGFKIIHPYHDKYSEHIELVEGILYKGLTEKGKFTIKTCNLNRYELAVSRVRQQIVSANPHSFSSELISRISNSKLVNEPEKFVEKVHAVLDKYKKSRKL